MPGPATSPPARTAALTRPETGTVALYSDIGCPWARLMVHRLHRARRRLGLEGRVRIEHRPFPLELVNRRPTPMSLVEAEAAVIAGLDEEIPWRPWSASPASYPVTTLPALEAVQAVQLEDPSAAERLDLALRDAFFASSRCISLVSVILDVAATVSGLDTDLLESALQDGRARHLVRRAPDGVQGSPHAFLADGYDAFNCGVRLHTLDSHVPVVDDNNPAAVDDLVRRTAR